LVRFFARHVNLAEEPASVYLSFSEEQLNIGEGGASYFAITLKAVVRGGRGLVAQ